MRSLLYGILALASLSALPAFGQCTLNGSPSPCSLPDGTVISTYTDTSGAGNNTATSGTLTNNGTMTIFGALGLVSDTSLTGPGTLTLNTGQIGTNGQGLTLSNSSTIQGSGVIGSNAITFGNLSLNNTGTVNANQLSSTLSIQGTGSSNTNGGTFEATGGGILTLATSAAIGNQNGIILAGDGSTVNLSGTIQGGTLTTQGTGIMQTLGSVILDASSQGAITLTDGSAYIAGAAGSTTQTFVTGTLNLGTVSGSTLSLGGALELTGDTTVATPGSGSITMANGQIGTSGSDFKLTNGGLIQGWGVIGSDATTFGNLSLTNNGTINANSTGNILSIQGNGASITNAGLLEATQGGTLILATAAIIGNQNGTILAGDGSTVNLSGTIQGGTLTTQGTGIVQTFGSVTLDASTLGAITLTDGSTYTAGAAGSTTQTFVTGALNLGTVSGSTLSLGGALELTGDTTVTTPGSGSITMTNAQIGTNGNDFRLTNGGLIQGSGVIGSDATTFGDLSLTNNGTINANQSGTTLSIQGNGSSIINNGTFEATRGGTLTLATAATIGNQNGTILAGDGSTVNLSGTIQGGTLTTKGTGIMQTFGSVILDASTAGAITITDGSTYTAGAAGSTTQTFVTGTLNLGTVSGSTLSLGGALELTGDTTVTTPGSGSITMTNAQIGTNGNDLRLTNGGLIQGSGVIGSDVTTFGDLSLTNNGTINANQSGTTLSIQGNGSSIINNGTFEATGGGTLTLATAAVVANQNGTILAGNGSTVNLSGTIQGGSLTTQGTGLMQTSGTVTLDAGTAGAITLTDGSSYQAGAGSLTNVVGQLNLGTSSAATTLVVTSTTTTGDNPTFTPGYLRLTGDTSVSGPGSIQLNGGLIGTDGGSNTLTNNALIQGYGVIGSNVGADSQNLSLSNAGTINANSDGNTLSIQGTGASIANTGLLEATNGGTLLLMTQTPIVNLGGNITAGNGSTVNVNAAIAGGTLNTLGSGVMQTLAGSTAQLDGSSQGAITISDGSTYTAGAGTLTTVLGTVNLGTATGGTLALGGILQLVGDTTLAGPGSLTLSGVAQIGTNGGAFLLTNNSTIQGNGLIGSNAGALTSNGSVVNNGSLIANGGTLTVANTGGLTNNGTMQANAGSTLVSTAGFANFSGNTLTGGTYNAFGTAEAAGTIQINALGTAQGGGEIVNNAATIHLDGLNSNIVDANGADALSAFANNLTEASFTISGGRDFTTPGSFDNAGMVDIGTGDIFTVAANADYSQSAGITQVDGSLTASGVEVDGGVLKGSGTVNGDVTVNAEGTVAPGDSPGTLTVAGDYTQAGTLDIVIGGTTAGSQYSVLDVDGNVNLSGMLDLSSIEGFDPTAGETFDVVDFGSGKETGMFSSATWANLAPGLTFSVLYNPTDVEVDIANIQTQPSSTPEPGTWLLFAGALVAFAAWRTIGIRKDGETA